MREYFLFPINSTKKTGILSPHLLEREMDPRFLLSITPFLSLSRSLFRRKTSSPFFPMSHKTICHWEPLCITKLLNMGKVWIFVWETLSGTSNSWRFLHINDYGPFLRTERNPFSYDYQYTRVSHKNYSQCDSRVC